jgi:tRNA-modifying protein YgfZ
VRGPDAAGHLERMLSNAVADLDVGGSCEALLLTPKARVVATTTVVRRGADDFLLLTEPEAGERLVRELLRSRFAARCEIVPEQHRSLLVLAAGAGALPSADGLVVANRDYGVPALELVDGDAPPGAEAIDESQLERLRILALTPRLGLDLDDRVLPAEAGLEERAISFTKGCYPGQEPVARLHYRGHPNRRLRLLAVDAVEPPPRDTELTHGGKAVGRVTSAVGDPEHGVVALGYVRREVPADAVLDVAGASARQL